MPSLRRTVRTRKPRVPRADAARQRLAMAGHRRRDPGRDPRRRGRGRARLAFLAVMAAGAVTAACPPGGLGGGPGFLGGGTGGGTPVATQLLGSWRNTRVVLSGGDTIITETVWTFST